MNIFILDTDPTVAAQMNCDTHVCKIILETAQMMSMAHSSHGINHSFLMNANSQRNNHVSKWVRATLGNYNWTAAHAIALCEEYTVRYGKVHNT
jgi:hypothetical protein